ncbi:MAG: carbamoyltransferase, partial [Proteobacteria bacterium]|nr:carbamoyltransferase [Pseudomonadota bacterium]
FAPATVVEHAERCYRGYGEGVEQTTRFMTMSLRTTPELQERCPAVVHVDGTARPQIVHPEPDPGYHAILTRFEQATGEPAVLNTSFNIHGEPIAASAEDALRIFERGAIDVLVLGPFVVTR